MLFLEDIKIELKSQGFEAKQISFSPTNDSAVVCFKSTRKTKDHFFISTIACFPRRFHLASKIEIL